MELKAIETHFEQLLGLARQLRQRITSETASLWTAWRTIPIQTAETDRYR